jgi:pimeloyl-ACP methyl ester carboxylesterase
MKTTHANSCEIVTSARQTGLRRAFAAATLIATFLGATACGGSDSSRANVKSDIAVSTQPSTSTATSTATILALPSTSATSTAPVPASAQPGPSTTPATTVARPTGTRDELVGGDGQSIHVRCTGSGPNTVLLIAGFEGSMEGWVKIEAAVSERARVCSYDRPGTGTSSPPSSTQTFATQATDLRRLLASIGEPGPYVVVGHSFGGAEAIMFASMFTNDVSGVALIDASPATWPAALCSVADDGTPTAATLRSTCTGLFLPTGNVEHLDVLPSFASVSNISSLGSLPMVVITATDRHLDGLDVAEAARLTDVWNTGQLAWANRSTAAHVVSVDHTGHHIEIDQPDVVIDEVTRLLAKP